MNRYSGSVLAFFLLLLSLATFGAKTDTVYLINGDRVTCEIKSLEYGLMKCSTDNFGTINIEFDKIRTFYSPSFFDIYLENGYRKYGSFGASSGTGTVWVLTQNDSILLPLVEIVEIIPIQQRFFSRLDGNFMVGFSYTKATSITQANFNGELSYRSPKYFVSTKQDFIRSIQEESTASSKSDLNLEGYRFFLRKWFAGTGLGYQHNSELDLQSRVKVTVAAGYDLIHNNFNRLYILSGITGNVEESIENPTRNENIEGLARLEYRIFVHDSPKITLTMYDVFFPSFTTKGRIRNELNVQGKFELISDLFFSLTFYNDLDNKPVGGQGAKNDWAVVTSLGYSF